MKLAREALVAGVCVAAATAAVWAAGNYSNYPIVAGASYCAAIVGSGPTQGGATGQGAGNAVTGTSTYCAQTVPAGPPSITGAEVVPIDTRNAGTTNAGPPPQSALLTMQELGVGYTYVPSASVTGTITIPNGVSIELLDPSSTVTNLTLVTPSAPLDGQFLRIASSHTITNFTLTAAAGQSIAAPSPTVLTASTTVNTGYTWMYNVSNTTWYRLQ